LTLVILISNFLDISINCGNLAIVPSSFIISTKVATGFSPANLHRSIAASVWPARSKTPPGLAIKGKICPGLPKSSALASSRVSQNIVLALSAADIPVVLP